MKVILTKDVEQLGDAGTLHEVKPGFARNYLIPKGLAQAATAGTIKQVQLRQAAEQRRIAKQEAEQQDLAGRIEGLRLEFVARAGAQGRLFGSVTSADIATKLSQLVGQEIDRRKVDLPGGIHEVGEVEVPIRLVGRLAPRITAVVIAEGSEVGKDDEGDEGDEGDEDDEGDEGDEGDDSREGAEGATGGEDEVSDPADTLTNEAGPGAEVADEMSGLVAEERAFERERE
jgi:large subunit ribosomal protein L9